jgi:hypothetical protein
MLFQIYLPYHYLGISSSTLSASENITFFFAVIDYSYLVTSILDKRTDERCRTVSVGDTFKSMGLIGKSPGIATNLPLHNNRLYNKKLYEYKLYNWPERH